MDLVEDDQCPAGSGPVVVQDRLRRHLRIGQGHTVVAGSVLALRILEIRVEFDAHARGRVGPLHLQVFGRSDHRHPIDDLSGQKLCGQPQSERGLAGARGGDCEKVLRLFLEVEFESLRLPGTQLPCRSPCGALGKGRWQLFSSGGPWCSWCFWETFRGHLLLRSFGHRLVDLFAPGADREPFGVAGRDPHLSAQGDQRSSRHHGLHDLVLGCVMAVSLVVSGLDKLLGLLALDR